MQQTLEPLPFLYLSSFVNHASTHCINKEICHQAYVWTHTQRAIHHPLKQNIAHCSYHTLLLIALPIAHPLFYQLSIISPNIRPSSHAITHCLLLSLSALVLVYRQVTQAAQVDRQSSISGGTKGHTSCTVPWSGSSTTWFWIDFGLLVNGKTNNRDKWKIKGHTSCTVRSPVPSPSLYVGWIFCWIEFSKYKLVLTYMWGAKVTLPVTIPWGLTLCIGC